MKKKVIDFIASRNGGRVTSSEIRDHFMIFDTPGNFITRQLIKSAMREVGNVPIGADNLGYYLIKTEDELNNYIFNLNSRIVGIEERISLVTKAWEERHVA